MHSRKSSAQAISNTAYKDYFYNIPPKFLKDDKIDLEANFYEVEFFAKNIEIEYSRLLKKINDFKIENHKITFDPLLNEEKEIFAALIAVQYLRLPSVIDEYWKTFQKTGDASLNIIKSFYYQQHPDQEKFIDTIELNLDSDHMPIEHSNLYTDPELIAKIQDLILEKIWIFNVTETNFHTCDNPIIFKPHIINERPYFYGFGMNGSEVIFPLGKNLSLSLFDSKYFSDKIILDNNYILIDAKKTREYNCYQYLFAEKEVYSVCNDFLPYELLKKDNNDKHIFLKQFDTKVNGK
jgi:hypothetical protein